MKERPTRERILEAAEALMLAKSFHSVGLNEILRAVNVPKGSFYHYFGSKEQFGVEMLKHYLGKASAHKRERLLSDGGTLNARQRLLAFFDDSIACFVENEGRCPCLVEKLASEVASFSEPMREVLAQGREDWIGIVAEVIELGSQAGWIHLSERAPREVAALLECLWAGAMQHASISRQPDALHAAKTFISEALIPQPS